MHTRSRRRAPLATRLWAIAALIALAAAYLTPIASPEWAAWSYDHGHATASGVVMPHTHPWDHAPVLGGTATTGSEDAAGAIVFTANGDSMPGITALWTAPAAGIVIAMLTCLVVLAAVVRPATYASVPAAPPPRGTLSTV